MKFLNHPWKVPKPQSGQKMAEIFITFKYKKTARRIFCCKNRDISNKTGSNGYFFLIWVRISASFSVLRPLYFGSLTSTFFSNLDFLFVEKYRSKYRKGRIVPKFCIEMFLENYIDKTTKSLT